LREVPVSKLVTTFQPARPRLMWSSEAKRRATLNGELYVELSVPTSPMCRVWTATADSSVSGSRRLR
jgi:hypothetical protein